MIACQNGVIVSYCGVLWWLKTCTDRWSFCAPRHSVWGDLITNLDDCRRTAALTAVCCVAEAASNDRHGPVSHGDPVTAPVISSPRIIITVRGFCCRRASCYCQSELSPPRWRSARDRKWPSRPKRAHGSVRANYRTGRKLVMQPIRKPLVINESTCRQRGLRYRPNDNVG